MKFSEDTNCTINVTPSSNSPVCSGKKLLFNVDSGYNYAWSGPNGFTSTEQNPFIDNATITNGGLYTVIVSDNCSCQKSYNVNVVIGDNQAPIPNLETLPTITGDCKTQITTTPTATDTCAGVITATTTSPLSFSLPGTYTIAWNYNDGNGKSASQDQIVIIKPQPVPTVSSSQTFCIHQNATLNSITITGQNIKWYDALNSGNLLANTTLLQNAKTYYASQTINGCESERSPVLINIQNTVTPTAISPQTFCGSQNPTLNTIVISGTTIKWYDSLTNGNLLPITTPLLDGQTYYATQTLNGCESPTRLAITVALISTLPSINYEEQFCDDSNDGTETVDLSSYNSKVISNTTSYFFTYYTSRSSAETETASSKIINFTNYKLAVGDNKIYVRINSNTPCYAVAELKLTLFSKPIINIPDIVPICENKSITIDAGAGFDSYLWSNGLTTPTITISNPETFFVTVTKNHNILSCSSTKNFTVKQSAVAKIINIAIKDWTDQDNTITVIATGAGEYEYSIDNDNFQESEVFSGLACGKYTIFIRDKNGCGTTTTKEVSLLMFPKFFTPNNDGFNDTWKIKFSESELGLIVNIFDRYGKFIKALVRNSDSWDGTFNGRNLPNDDYWFTVKRANGQEHKGHFSLKR